MTDSCYQDTDIGIGIGSICSGIEGIGLGVARATGGTVVWHTEIEPAPSRVLEARFPGTPNHGDITTLDWSTVEPVDILTAGYPCQPFSLAGQRKGTSDERHLWPFVADAIRVLRPGYVFLENVPGHLSLGFGTVLGDLAASGFDAEWGCVRAAQVGTPHRRERVFVLARNADEIRRRARARLCESGAIEDRYVAAGAGRHRAAADSDGGAVGQQPVPDARSRATLDVAFDAAPAADADGTRLEGPEPAQRRDVPAGCVDLDEETDALERSLRDLEPGDGDRRPHMGRYEPAVVRWESIHGPAPHPLDSGRLSADFTCWLMGFPPGWVDLPGVSRNEKLKMLGNAVVPACAELAWRLLL